MKEYLENSLPQLLGFLWNVLMVIILLVVGLKLIKFVIKTLRKMLEKSNVEQGVITFLCSLCKYALYFLLGFIILTECGVEAGAVTAIVGSAGLTLGLALQGSLSNFAGGVLLLLIKPFVVGDYIVENGDKQEGVVSEVSIFYTKLVTPDNKVILMPNGKLANSSIVNLSTMNKRRVDLTFGVSYDSDLAKVKVILNDVIAKEASVLENEAVDIFVSELCDSCVNVGLRVWVQNEDYWSTKWRITENVKLALDENGVSIPFPQIDVQIKQ